MTENIFRHYGGSIAADAFAGEGSEWISANGMPQNITYELKNKAAVCKITFLPRKDNSYGNVPRDCPKNFRIEGSHDGSYFKRIHGVVGKKK